MSFPLRTRTRGRPGRNAGVVNVAAAPSFNPLTGWTTDPVHAVWASDPLWTPPADGGAVSSWRNGGSVGGDLVQATGAAQPTYDAALAAYNGAAVVSFTTDDALDADVADVAQPHIFVVIGNTSGGTNLEGLIAVTGASTSRVMGDNAAGAWTINNNTAISGGTADGNPHLFVGKVIGGANNFKLDVDGTNVATGTASVGTSFTRFTLGAGSMATPSYGNHLTGSIAYAAVFDVDPTAQAEWASFVTWAETTYGLVIA
jgi:hypothetical protein